MTQLMLFSVKLSSLPDSVVSQSASMVENLLVSFDPLKEWGPKADLRSSEVI